MLRDFRTKESSAGVAFTEKEREGWQRSVIEFFRVPVGETPAAKKRRVSRASTQVPRLATLDFLRAIEHGMVQATGLKFADFDSKHLLNNAVDDDNHKVVFGPNDIPNHGKVPRLLTLTSDQQSTQTCAVSFLQFKLGLNVCHHPDPFHLGWNDVLEAVTKSGMQGSVEAALAVYNVAYGPFQKSAFFNYMQEGVHDIAASLGPNDALLMRFWVNICRDEGRTGPEMGQFARMEWLSQLPTLKPGQVKGPKASKSRWFSFLASFRFWDTTWHTKLFLICFIALRSGWAKSITDILCQSFDAHTAAVREVLADSTTDLKLRDPSVVGDIAAAPPAALPSSGASSSSAVVAVDSGAALAPASSSSSGASSSSGVAAAPLGAPASSSSSARPQSRASAEAAGKAKVDAERNRSVNTLHAVARLMSNADLLQQLRMIALATNPWGLNHGDAAHAMRTPDSNAKFYAEWATWSFP